MIIPVKVTFRNITSTPEVENEIRARTQKLEKFYAPITSCRVLIEASAGRRQKGNPFNVRIGLTVREGEIIVKRAPTLYPSRQDMGRERMRKEMETQPQRKHLKVAIREAFDAAARRLEDHARRRRSAVKTHEPAPEARVTQLFPVQGYGYIETRDGREIYFHANSVINNRFKALKLGSKVRFAEELGEKGPQASTVRLITKAQVAPFNGRLRSSNRKAA